MSRRNGPPKRQQPEPLSRYLYKGWFSEKDREAYERDERLALMLLLGHRQGVFTIEVKSKADLIGPRLFLSKKTNPTEKR